MRAKIAGHEFTYCHHSMGKGAQMIGAFIVENELTVEDASELFDGMVADAAFDWKDEQAAKELKSALSSFGLAFRAFCKMLRSIPEKKVVPKTKEEWTAYFGEHMKKAVKVCEGWNPHGWKDKR